MINFHDTKSSTKLHEVMPTYMNHETYIFSRVLKKGGRVLLDNGLEVICQPHHVSRHARAILLDDSIMFYIHDVQKYLIRRVRGKYIRISHMPYINRFIAQATNKINNSLFGGYKSFVYNDELTCAARLLWLDHGIVRGDIMHEYFAIMFSCHKELIAINDHLSQFAIIRNGEISIVEENRYYSCIQDYSANISVWLEDL